MGTTDIGGDSVRGSASHSQEARDFAPLNMSGIQMNAAFESSGPNGLVQISVAMLAATSHSGPSSAMPRSRSI